MVDMAEAAVGEAEASMGDTLVVTWDLDGLGVGIMVVGIMGDTLVVM